MRLKKIRKLIADSGLMQKHIAAKINISREHLNRVLRGHSPLTAEIADNLELFLSK